MKRKHAWMLLIPLNATGAVLLWILNTWALTPIARTVLTINALINAGLGLWLLPRLFRADDAADNPAHRQAREGPPRDG